jgi:probable blue pigment (indigoidine) exporter
MNILGLGYLGLIGAGLTYVIWLRGIRVLQPSSVSILGFLSPLSAPVLGWFILNESLSWMQGMGMAVVLGSVFVGQYALRPKAN